MLSAGTPFCQTSDDVSFSSVSDIQQSPSPSNSRGVGRIDCCCFTSRPDLPLIFMHYSLRSKRHVVMLKEVGFLAKRYRSGIFWTYEDNELLPWQFFFFSQIEVPSTVLIRTLRGRAQKNTLPTGFWEGGHQFQRGVWGGAIPRKIPGNEF